MQLAKRLQSPSLIVQRLQCDESLLMLQCEDKTGAVMNLEWQSLKVGLLYQRGGGRGEETLQVEDWCVSQVPIICL